MTNQPGVYVGELPPSFAFGRCVLSVAYAAQDSLDDEDKLPELRVPNVTTLTLTPNLSGAFLADGKVMLPTPTTFTSTDGTFDFWAIDASHSQVTPSNWAWVAQLSVGDRVISRFEFQPDSTRAADDPYNLGPLAVLAAAPSQPTQAELQGILNEILANASEGPRGYPGEDGHTPVLSWNGTVLVIDGVEGPDLKGPKGDKGDPGPPNVLAIGTVTQGTAAATITGASPNQTLNLVVPKGDPGPPNTLSIGTVTTGATGTNAAASITGTAPSQTLNLTLPAGPKGDPGTGGTGGGTNTHTGTGFPAAGLGAVGDTYLDTAATSGALVWRKYPSGHTTPGWQVTEGDTGWREITSLMPANFVVTSGAGSPAFVRVRRMCRTVWMDLRYTGTTTITNISMPAGFDHNSVDGAKGVLIPTDPAGVAGKIQYKGGGGFEWKPAGSSAGFGLFQYVAGQQWPSTLPGTPVA